MDYFNHGSTRRRAVPGDENNHQQANGLPQHPPGRTTPVGTSLESLRAPSSIRIRRLPSGHIPHVVRPTSQHLAGGAHPAQETEQASRRRSFSAPQRYNPALSQGNDLSRQHTSDARGGHQPIDHMETITEMRSVPLASTASASRDANRFREPEEQLTPNSIAETPSPSEYAPALSQQGDEPHPVEIVQDAGNAARRNRGLRRLISGASLAHREQPVYTEYDSDVIDLLDLVDPEVRTLGTLTNVQNSLFVPDLGRLINRRPTYELSRPPSAIQENWAASALPSRAGRSRAGTLATRPDLPTTSEQPIQEAAAEEGIEMQQNLGVPNRRLSISSALSESRYAVLPHGVSLEGWSEEDKAELNDHVRHLMHSRREGFKRNLRGFKQYISKPLGLFVFVYATLVTLFGAAWVFFLIGFIYVGSRQDYIINVVDLILVALFALIGDGLAPFRAVDTYHMCFIARYHHMTWRLRREKQLAPLADHNDLPDRHASPLELEDALVKDEMGEFSVLTPAQQRRLQYHAAKFSKAHTFYRPHETATHHAFPLRLLVAVVVLLDCHSLFQIALGTITWSWNYHTRPKALTPTILSCSITCNIMAGVLISIGDHRTRKKDVLERIKRQNLTEEALGLMKRQRSDNDTVVQNSIEPQMAAMVKDENGAPVIPEDQRPANLLQSASKRLKRKAR